MIKKNEKQESEDENEKKKRTPVILKYHIKKSKTNPIMKNARDNYKQKTASSLRALTDLPCRAQKKKPPVYKRKKERKRSFIRK